MILKGIVDRISSIKRDVTKVKTGLMLEDPILIMVACWPEHHVEIRVDTRKTRNVAKTLAELAGIIGQIASNGNYQELLSDVYNQTPAIISVEFTHFGRHYGLYRSLNK